MFAFLFGVVTGIALSYLGWRLFRAYISSRGA